MYGLHKWSEEAGKKTRESVDEPRPSDDKDPDFLGHLQESSHVIMVGKLNGIFVRCGQSPMNCRTNTSALEYPGWKGKKPSNGVR